MKKEIKGLLLLFLVITLVKIIFSYFTPAPSAFSDNYIYIRTAWEFFHNGGLFVNGISSSPPLYSMLISIAYVFEDMENVFIAMKVINSIVSSLVVFPIYFLARDFLSSKKSRIVVVLSALIVPHFLFPNFIMAENLFFPLVAFVIYFLYLSFKKQNSMFFVISGLLIGLSILTKAIGYALIPACFFIFLFLRGKFKNVIYHYLALGLLFIPYQYWKAVSNPKMPLGYSNSGTIGKVIANLTTNIASFINWNINYIGFIMLALGVVFVIVFLALIFTKKEKDFKTLFSVVVVVSFFTVLLAVNSSAFSVNGAPYITWHGFTWYLGRPLGRYIASVLPFIFLVGFIGFQKRLISYRKFKIFALISIIVLAISTYLTLSSLFPVNNSSLTLFGTLQLGLKYVFADWSYFLIGLIFILLPLIAIFIYKKKKIVIGLVFFFLLVSCLLAYSIHLYNMESYWANNDQVILGKWIDDNLEGIIVIDTRDCEWHSKEDMNNYLCTGDDTRSSVVGMWVNNPVIVSDTPDGDYFVTIRDMNMELVKEVGKFKVYS
ncbi:MAG: glycosyltransferase family 39 protein [archaeon]